MSKKILIQSKRCLISLSFVFILTIVTVTLFLYNKIDVEGIPQSLYLIVVVALFFIDVIVSVFMFIQFSYNKEKIYFLFLGLSFLSGTVYFVETLIVIQPLIDICYPLEDRANDVAIFYFFRQVSFIILLFMALFCAFFEKNVGNYKYPFCIASVFLLIAVPVLAYNLSSYNPDMSIVITYYNGINDSQVWVMQYVYFLLALWLLSVLSVFFKMDLSNDIWRSVLVVCISGFFCNFILLFLPEYNISIWYISRGLEVISKLCVIFVLIYNVFSELNDVSEKAFRDPLTKIYNRRFFFDYFDEFLKNKNAHDFCFLIMDIDHFKRINDKYGHKVGDDTIVAVSEIMSDTLMGDGLLARIGGEEFAALLPGISMKTAKEIAEQLRFNVQNESLNHKNSGVPEKMTVCIGGYYVRKSGGASREIMSKADFLLYEAKRTGRNKVIFNE